jgi:broad specificity phosphatase PhoE
VVLVHLVRHGAVDNPEHIVYGTLPGFGLSAVGQEQARGTAAYLGRRPVSEVWSSPLERAMETAAIIAFPHRLPVQTHPALTEWSIDSWTGIRWEDLPELRPGQLEAYREDPTRLRFVTETLDEVARRVAAAVDEIQRAAPGEVVAVGHQDPLQAARLLLTGRPLTAQHRDKPGHGTVITLAPGEPWQEIGRFSPSPSG